MAASKIDKDALKSLLHVGMSNRAIAKELGVNESSVRGAKKQLIKRGWSPEHDMTHEVPEGYLVKGTSTLYDGGGNIKAQWVKSSIDEEKQKAAVEAILKSMVSELPQVYSTPRPDNFNDSLMAVYPLGDPHIGMLAWEKECGESWDLEIAERAFCTVFDRVVKTAPKCKHALIVNLGDYFHYDNINGTTPAHGNILDRDSRYAKMVAIGVKVIRQMINSALEHHETVEVINAIGNHDEVSAQFLSICLAHIYENEPRVYINASPTYFHYKRFGHNLIGVHHGHKCKMDKLPSVMAAAMSKDWGETKYRCWLTGHIHHDSKIEVPGCTVESFRTLAARDAYGTAGGWISGRDTKAIVYHRNWGEIERHTVNIDTFYGEGAYTSAGCVNFDKDTYYGKEDDDNANI